MISLLKMGERAGDVLFWKRFAVASAVGYVYAVFGFSVTFSLLGTVSTMMRYPPEGTFWGIAGFLLTLPHLVIWSFLFGLFLAALPVLTTLPVAAITALALRAGRTGTLFAGTVLGALIGTPVALGRMLEQAGDWIMVGGCAGAGAMFALAVWKFCLRHYNAANETPAPGWFLQWWSSRDAATKAAVVIAGVAVVASFL